MSRINGTSLGISGSTGHQLRGAAKQLHAAKAEHDRYMRAIGTLDRYVVEGEDGAFELTVERPQDAGVDPEVFAELKLSLAISGTTRAHRAGAAAQAGGDPSQHHWWGMKIVVDEHTTPQLVDAAQKSTAAIAAVLLGLGVAAPVASAIGRALFVLPGLLWAVCAYGGRTGLVVYRTWSGHVWIWHQ